MLQEQCFVFSMLPKLSCVSGPDSKSEIKEITFVNEYLTCRACVEIYSADTRVGLVLGFVISHFSISSVPSFGIVFMPGSTSLNLCCDKHPIRNAIMSRLHRPRARSDVSSKQQTEQISRYSLYVAVVFGGPEKRRNRQADDINRLRPRGNVLIATSFSLYRSRLCWVRSEFLTPPRR